MADRQESEPSEPVELDYEGLVGRALNDDASLEAGNARWWPQYFGSRMYLRPWTDPVARLRRLFLKETQLLEPADCVDISARVEDMREHWDAYPEEGLHRLGGAVCTLRASDEAFRQASRARLLSAFPSLYTRVLDGLKSVLKTDAVRYSDLGFVPGFVINEFDWDAYDGWPLWRRLAWHVTSKIPSTGFHWDGQASVLGLTPEPNACPQLTFILMLQLPKLGHGLYVFNSMDWEHPERAILSARAYVPYKVGGMVVFDGLHWHMPAQPRWSRGDRRIIMVGHGLSVDGTWHIYF